ncbi:MAG TPA: hypothetical protein VF829_02625 [Candidatus Paceibacterota bacterium]
MKKIAVLVGVLVALLVSVAAASAETVEVLKDGSVRLVPFDAPQQFEISHEQWEELQKAGIVPITRPHEVQVGRAGLFRFKKQTVAYVALKREAISGIIHLANNEVIEKPKNHLNPLPILWVIAVSFEIALAWMMKRGKWNEKARILIALIAIGFTCLVAAAAFSLHVVFSGAAFAVAVVASCIVCVTKRLGHSVVFMAAMIAGLIAFVV